MANDSGDAQSSDEARQRRLGVALWTRLARVYARNIRLTEQRLHASGLTAAQFDALAQIGAHEGLTQRELALRLLVTQGAITQLLDKLERRGLIQRCPDGRLKRLVLTDTGRSLRDSVVPGQERFQAERFAALTATERRTLLTLLSKLQRAQSADETDHCDDVERA